MAYTVNQSTTGLQGAWDDLIYVVNDTTNTAEPDYRYICSIRVGGAELMKLKQLPNNANAAVFNTQRVCEGYVYQDDNPYQLGAIDLNGDVSTTEIFSTNTSALQTFTMRFGYEFTTSPGTAPTVVLTDAFDTEVVVVNGQFISATQSSPSNGSSPYEMNGVSPQKLLLSDIPIVQPNTGYIPFPYVCKTSILYRDIGTESQYRTMPSALAFINGTDLNSIAAYMHVSYYDGAIALNTGYFENDALQGGAFPTASLTDSQSLIYVGVGTYNLNTQAIDTSLRPSDAGNSGWTHYDVQMASSTTLSGNKVSACYRFERVSCGRYITPNQVFSLHWWNSKGGIDNLPMLGKVVESQTMDKKSYRTSGGNSFDATGIGNTAYKRNSYSGGKRSTDVHTTTTYELSTIGGDPEILTPMIQSLLNSPRVFLWGKGVFGLNYSQDQTGLVQAFVTDTRLVMKSGVNDQASSYKVVVEISRRRVNG
tara:strand:- start:4159 stop:5595 length:1437 start_codon:yes stop_codon:yes gene_type:complete